MTDKSITVPAFIYKLVSEYQEREIRDMLESFALLKELDEAASNQELK